MNVLENFTQPPVSEDEHKKNLEILAKMGQEKVLKELQECGVVDPEALAKELLESEHVKN